MSEIDSNIEDARQFTIYRCVNGFALSTVYTHGGIAPQDMYVYSEFKDLMEHLHSLLEVDKQTIGELNKFNEHD